MKHFKLLGIPVIGLLILHTFGCESRVVPSVSSAGSLDTTFGGDVNPADGIPDGFVVHDNAAGGANAADAGYSIAIHSNDKIYVAGSSASPTGNLDMVIWRYMDTGTLDASFGGGNGFVTHNNAAGGNNADSGRAIALDLLGRIYVAGYSRNAANDYDMAVWRYTDTGALDTSFGGGNGYVVHDNAAGGNGNDFGRSITLDSLNRVYIAGDSQNGAGSSDMVIWRYTDTGILDASFGGGNGYAVHDNAAGGGMGDSGESIVLDSLGKIYVAGYSWNAANDYDMAVWRYTDTGVLDTSFGDGNGYVVHDNAAGGSDNDFGRSITLDSQGRIYVTGESENLAMSEDMVVWRYTGTGILDTSFGGGNGFVIYDNVAGGGLTDSGRSIALDSLGRIYVAGYSWNSVNTWDMAIWRYMNDGTLDNTFGDGGGVLHNGAAGDATGADHGQSITLDLLDKIYVTGFCWNTAGNSDLVIWRYNK